MPLNVEAVGWEQIVEALRRFHRITDSDEEAAAIGVELAHLYVTRDGRVVVRAK